MTISRLALLSTSPAATDAVLRKVAAAFAVMLPQVALAWQPVYPEIVAPDVRIVSAVSELTDGDTPFLFTMTIDDPGAEAYHFLDRGVPYALVWAPPGATVDEITERAAHEGAEMLVDPGCALYDGAGYAVEVADALQGVEAWVDTAEGRVRVCAWCEPAWFGLDAGAVMLDSAGACSEAHQILAGGYGQRMTAAGVVDVPEGVALPAEKSGPHARRMRRRRATR